MNGWKAQVIERHPRAVGWSKMDKASATTRYTVFAEPDGVELGISTISTADAWRVAALNISEGVPAGKAPGQALLL